ncbi:MAG: N-acetyl-gamma-glutamyl-phosphate reductase, partial [Clostridiaceae bacterium]|nr:N-acetyl-gamma-glutamyl-phosphate reductase [Clostridiaceae bacterium]
MVNVSVLGATGYAGYELVRLLAQHPRVEIKNLVSKNFAGKKISDIYPSLAGVCDILCTELDIDTIKETSDIVFCALPHGASKEVIPKLY